MRLYAFPFVLYTFPCVSRCFICVSRCFSFQVFYMRFDVFWHARNLRPLPEILVPCQKPSSPARNPRPRGLQFCRRRFFFGKKGVPEK